jgi:hypothetical protein
MGLTALGLAVLAAATPGPRRLARWLWTTAAFLPLLPLGVVYRSLMRAGGGVSPEWNYLKHPFSLAAWGQQLGWVDPITLASKRTLPFLQVSSPWFGLAAPVLWFAVALAALVLATLRRSTVTSGHEPGGTGMRQGWAVLAGILVLGGVVGPDTMGIGHGDYLPQRVFLLGLVALLPYLELGAGGWTRRVATAALGFALVVQSATVWAYALEADRLATPFIQAASAVGKDQRVGTLQVDIRGRYRANPMMHVDNLLGIDTGNILWSNYETTHYYFPVQLCDPDRHPPAWVFEAVTILEDPRDAPRRLKLWRDLLEEYHGEIDVLVTWGSKPELDAVNERFFAPDFKAGPVRVLKPHNRARARPPASELELRR